MLDVTIIVPFSAGTADINGDVSAGIRVYAGKLTQQQILKLTEEPSYPQRAVAICHNSRGVMQWLEVTFSTDRTATPRGAASVSGDLVVSGDAFEGAADLSYNVHYLTVQEAPPG